MMNRRLRLSMVALIAGGTAAAALAVDSPALAAPAAQQTTQARTGAAATEATTSATHVATHVAAHVAARRGRGRGHAHAQRYAWERVAPAKLPDGSSTGYGSTAVGIDDAGRVAGNIDVPSDTGPDMPFFGKGSGSRWLDVAGIPGERWATAVSPTGVVVGDLGGSEDVYLSWSRHGSRSQVATPDSYYGPHPTAVNSSGVVAGTLGSVKLNSLFYGRPGSLREVPISKYGNFDVAGISESGTAAGTLNAPYYQTDLRYPEGVLFTAAGVQTVKANATSAVDAISPNGRHVVGRVGGTNSDLSPNTPAWLSTSRQPDRLRGAAGFRARDVSDAGLVVGTWRGHAAVWQNGSLTDLNGQVRGLPSGWVLTDAVAINKSGALAVNAKDGSGNAVALKLTVR